MMPAEKKSGRGCLFWGGIIAAVLFLFVLLAVYAGYRYVKNLVVEYTDTKPLDVPVVQLSGTEITNLQHRVQSFDKALKQDKPVQPLILSADEINALIQEVTKTNPVPVRLYFSFNDDRVQAQLSVPTDGFGLRMLKGRYFNGSGDFALSLHDGRLNLRVQSLSVKGRPLPEQFMQGMRTQNFADSWTNDADFNQAIGKLEEIKIEKGKLIVTPKPVEDRAAPTMQDTNAPPDLEKQPAAKQQAAVQIPLRNLFPLQIGNHEFTRINTNLLV